MKNKLLFSLIVPTLGNSDEISYLIESLKSQTYKYFELIIIDQNKDYSVKTIIENYFDKLDIKYVRSNKKGLSVNRNIGINLAKGEIFSFPDDDCTYPPEQLQIVHDFFQKRPEYQIYSCCALDNKLNKRFEMAKKNSFLTPYNYFNKCISIGIFIKHELKSNLCFDNNLGVGAEFGSAEESDFISSLLAIGYKGKYFANNYTYHEYPSIIPNTNRYLNYGKGYGALMKKEIILREKYRFIFPFILDISIRAILSIIPTKKRKFYSMSMKGRVYGFLKYKINEK